MANHITHIDELVEYPKIVLDQLTRQQSVLDLLSNKKGATYEDLEDADGNWTCLFDYNFVPGTIQEVGSYICVDTDIVDVPTGTIMKLNLYVDIIVHKDIMRINPLILPGYIGNRRDNLARYCDLALRRNKSFGIGPLQLLRAVTFSAGNTDYTGKRLIYLADGFSVNRSKLP